MYIFNLVYGKALTCHRVQTQWYIYKNQDYKNLIKMQYTALYSVRLVELAGVKTPAKLDKITSQPT